MNESLESRCYFEADFFVVGTDSNFSKSTCGCLQNVGCETSLLVQEFRVFACAGWFATLTNILEGVFIGS
jgi:hypothetical protein